MQGQATFDQSCSRGVHRHVTVDLFVEKPVCDRFIADQRLIVTFDVGDTLLREATISQYPGDMANRPVFVFRFF